MSDRTCVECIFCRQSDYGYSNWTAEGTTAACIFNLSPEFDTYPNGQQKIAFEAAKKIAETCKAFRAGTGLYEDVDGEERERGILGWIEQYVK